jgi:Putative zinc-finger
VSTDPEEEDQSMTASNRDPSKCPTPELKDLHFLFVNMDVTPEERQRIEEHLAECAECREDVLFFLDLKEAWLRRRHWTSNS